MRGLYKIFQKLWSSKKICYFQSTDSIGYADKNVGCEVKLVYLILLKDSGCDLGNNQKDDSFLKGQKPTQVATQEFQVLLPSIKAKIHLPFSNVSRAVRF